MKIAILGGSFNPIHIGHLALADEVIALGYDKILFIPTASAPHKKMAFPILVEDRIKMISLAIQDNPYFELENCEIERGGISYTWDTVCYLEKKYSGILEEKIGLIIGSDQLETFHLWKNAKEISEKCQLILGCRPIKKEDARFSNKAIGEYADYKSSVCENKKINKEKLFSNAIFLDNELLSISSTQIRTRFAKKQSFRYLVPEKVFKYIIDGNIYENND